MSKEQLDAEYKPFSGEQSQNFQDSEPPSRYKVKTSDPDKQARSQARAEARRTRRTLRLQAQAEKEQHYKITTAGDSSDESSVDENYDCDSLAESEVENLTWRGRMQHVLHHHWFHLVIAILVSVDAVIVVFELLIDVGAFNNVLCEGTNFVEQAETCHYRNRTQCYPLAKMILEGTNISASPTDTGMNSEVCVCGFRRGRRVCIRMGERIGINPAVVLHILSILILSSFLVEILLKIIAFRLKYFTHKFEVFDGMIVVISWMLDVASIVQEEAFEAASLIIVLRLWRVIRIVNGAVISSKSQSDQQLERSREEARKIIHALHKAQDKMDQLEEENIKLKKGRR